jgi:hypothetical protein
VSANQKVKVGQRRPTDNYDLRDIRRDRSKVATFSSKLAFKRVEKSSSCLRVASASIGSFARENGNERIASGRIVKLELKDFLESI